MKNNCVRKRGSENGSRWSDSEKICKSGVEGLLYITLRTGREETKF